MTTLSDSLLCENVDERILKKSGEHASVPRLLTPMYTTIFSAYIIADKEIIGVSNIFFQSVSIINSEQYLSNIVSILFQMYILPEYINMSWHYCTGIHIY